MKAFISLRCILATICLCLSLVALSDAWAYECDYEVGMGAGGRGVYDEGFWETEEECAMQCIAEHRSKKYKEINGATYRVDNGQCWCKRAMTYISTRNDFHKGHKSCFIENISDEVSDNLPTMVATGEQYRQGAPLWTNRRTADGRFWDVPYKLDPTFGSEDNPDDKIYFDTLNLVIENIQNTTCIRFTKIDFDNEDIFPYIRFQDDNGKCGSPIGQRAAEPKFDERFINTINVNDVCRKSFMAVIHELVHSLGFGHALDRPDRDEYLTVHWENVKEGALGCFPEHRIARTQKYNTLVFLEAEKMTVDMCRLHCLVHDLYKFGVQAPNKCFCTPNWQSQPRLQADKSLCNRICDEEENEPCGGDGYYSVYDIKRALPLAKWDNAVGFPMDRHGVMMGGGASESRWPGSDPRRKTHPTFTYKDGSHIKRPKRVGISDLDVKMINKVYGCQKEEE